MKAIYRYIELLFERLTEFALRIFGNSVTFIIACFLVIGYLANKKFYTQDFHDCIRDIVLSITFLSFFIIQKAFNKFFTATHIKINELVAAHDKASNRMVNVEQKTEEELNELAKYYSDLAKIAGKEEDIHAPHSIEHLLNTQEEEDEKANNITDSKS